MTTTAVWLLMDDDTVLQAYATETEALRELQAHQHHRDPQPVVALRVVTVEVDLTAGQVGWQLRRGYIEQVGGSKDAAERAGVKVVADADEEVVRAARSLGAA